MNNEKVAKELIRIAKNLVALNEEENGPYEKRWSDMEKIGQGIIGIKNSWIYIYMPNIASLDQGYRNKGVITVEELEKIPEYIGKLVAYYQNADNVTVKVLNAIKSSKYVRYNNYENDIRHDDDYIDVPLEATDEIYKIACDKYDEILKAQGLDPEDYDQIGVVDAYGKAIDEAEKLALDTFKAEFNRIAEIASKAKI